MLSRSLSLELNDDCGTICCCMGAYWISIFCCEGKDVTWLTLLKACSISASVNPFLIKKSFFIFSVLLWTLLFSRNFTAVFTCYKFYVLMNSSLVTELTNSSRIPCCSIPSPTLVTLTLSSTACISTVFQPFQSPNNCQVSSCVISSSQAGSSSRANRLSHYRTGWVGLHSSGLFTFRIIKYD